MSDALRFCVPCLFGLEGLCADELRRLGHTDVKTENGRVLFSGSVKDAAEANIWLRTGERVLLVVGETNAFTFDELFEGVRAMPGENYIPPDGAFPIKGHSLGSKLHSIPDCQKIIKKATATRLQKAHKTEMLRESAAKYQIQFAIMDDIATLYIDTSGAGLHKRGYRPVGSVAPLRETLASAIVKLSRYRGREQVYDPFCGSGTIPIEAALAAVNRAPGLYRSFSAEDWSWIDKSTWSDVREDAVSREYDGEYSITGSDIDPECVEISKKNAKRAGISKHIQFRVADATEFSIEAPGGIILTNPPYGERMMDQRQAQELYRKFGIAVREQISQHGQSKRTEQSSQHGKPTQREADILKMYILSSHTEFERVFGKKAVKKRKLYNGMVKCDLFMYF